MKITKLWEGLKQIANGDYVLEGDLICDEDLVVELDDRLVVRGKIEVKKSIKAGCGIEAGESIKAGYGIKAGWGIKAKTFIHSEKRIFAGLCIYHTSGDCKKHIKCAELRKGEICYGDLIIEEPVVEMTIAEIEAKLGIKNLKIKQPAEGDA